ncbi:peptide ABC transporter substrate-binding protein [Cohnella luojiensis]|uniref:Peptide ABC transporter substrate-binding protein n=1 Tax=Cohnella luojiensis TaxID=652876 RepID=A0A4Y8M0E2_9BACL|nr:peptide ABC transporter substrate-binding protein [Cohnella luojiensis]TFE25200.1 peptide ABC transporter substrate-binding protein [Cohnella luojiensis]
MRITKLFLSLAILSVMLATACSNTMPTKDIGKLYSLALDAYMPIDEGLNGGMKYIAIDMSNFKDLDDKDKGQILKHFNKYNVEVMEATYEQLKAKGLYDPKTMVLNGILLRVEKTEILNNKFVVEGSKYRAALGAIGTKVVVELKNDKWQVTKAATTWES